MDLTWTLDGSRIGFAGPLSDETEPSLPIVEFSEVWLMNSDGSDPNPILPDETVARWQSFYYGWLDENNLIYTGYAGGGHQYWSILDIENREKRGWGIVHLGGGEANSQYIGTINGTTLNFQISAAIVATTPQHSTADDGLNSPYLHHLSFDDEERVFNYYSSFQDWRPDSNEMLVITWDLDVNLAETNFLHNNAVTSLQLWNVEDDSLTPVVSEAIYGRFSPDGRYLLYLTPAPEHPIAHLYNWQNQQIILQQPVVAAWQPGNSIKLEMSFSPNGRFLTYFTPNEDGTSTLQVFDTQADETQREIINPETQVSWSPTSEQFIYRDANNNFALFSIANGSSQPLTLAGGLLLTNPQWSHDGRFLSVSVQTETGGETAVLTLNGN